MKDLQGHLPLVARLDGPSVVPAEIVRRARTYREAVRLSWSLRRVHHMTLRQLAAEAELLHQHVGDYLNPDDRPTRRSLPGDAVKRWEAVVGNTLVSQWHAMQAQLTVIEELQAEAAQRRAA